MLVTAQLLDAGHGLPAADVLVRLEARVETGWHAIATERTDGGGQCELGKPESAGRGIYRLVCETDPYYLGLGAEPRYPEVVVTFRVLDDASHSHFVILAAIAGYTVYLSR
jgi:5-hydroxyisourate hydrolase